MVRREAITSCRAFQTSPILLLPLTNPIGLRPPWLVPQNEPDLEVPCRHHSPDKEDGGQDLLDILTQCLSQEVPAEELKRDEHKQRGSDDERRGFRDESCNGTI